MPLNWEEMPLWARATTRPKSCKQSPRFLRKVRRSSSSQSIAPEIEMLRALAYIWAVFGASWVILAPALGSLSPWKRRFQTLRLAFLAVTFGLLLWKAQVI